MTPIERLLDTVNWEATGAQAGDDDLPYATHAGVLNLFGLELRCYRLSNGQAVFDADDVRRFFGGAL